ncbi:MAG: PEP-CTERM sorting domain-containing protein [Myxococcota bacterium]
MFKNWLRGALSVAMIAGFAGNAGAVGLAGNYHESNGIIINIPQNQPLVDCDASAENARCHAKGQGFFGLTPNIRTSAPARGAQGQTSTPGDARSVGASFTMPPNFMAQFETQDAQVLNNVAIYLITSFMASAPGDQRATNLGLTSMDVGYAPNADTRVFAPRVFSVANLTAHGQNNGLAQTDPNYMYRQAVNTTVTDTFNTGLENVTLTYSGGGFSGTASLLLDGGGQLFVGGPNIDQLVGNPAFNPIIGRNPLGDGIAGNPQTRNGAGWGFVINGGQAQGTAKAFGLAATTVLPGGFCTSTVAPALPAGCNIVTGFDSTGFTVFPFPSATSAKHVFAWTTGNVTVTRIGTRMQGGQTIVDTQIMIGDGHDSVSTFATGVRRNVGLVAGSYSKRTDGTGGQQINAQLAGMNLVFTPEPASAVALLAGVGLLGTMAVRRGRR